jgi:hypothetical protein
MFDNDFFPTSYYSSLPLRNKADKALALLNDTPAALYGEDAFMLLRGLLFRLESNMYFRAELSSFNARHVTERRLVFGNAIARYKPYLDTSSDLYFV